MVALPQVQVQTEEFKAKPIEPQQSRVDRAIRARQGVKGKHVQGGRCIGYTQDPQSGQVHVVGSVMAQLLAGQDTGAGIAAEHVRYRKIAGRGRRNILFVVDTSGSMVASGRLGLVKGCVMSLLGNAYVERTRVAVVGYGGVHARVVVPFTSSAELAARCIDVEKGGGSTPLLDALQRAQRLIETVEDEPVEVVVLSDGGFNRERGVATTSLIRGFASYCARNHVPLLFIDTGAGTRTATKRAQRLAALLHARYRKLDALRVDDLVEAVEAAARETSSQ